MKRTTVGAMAAAAGLTVATLGNVPAAAASTNDYVALGDSYSAGVGAGNYIDDGTDCHRSPESLGGLIAGGNGLSLDLQACSGAVVADLTEQYPALSPGTDLVTLTIGGNDIGFAPVVTECLKPGWWGDCEAAITEAEGVLNDELPSQLDGVYDEISSRAPNAEVVVAGYPRLFNGEDCHVATFFTGDEMSALNTAADDLNNVIEDRVANAGFTYADVAEPFDGHAVCDDDEWIHNVRVPTVTESFHPKPAGHVAYAGAMEPGLFGSSRLASPLAVPSPAQVSTGKAVSANTEADRPKLPDLDSAEARDAAAAAGVSDAEVEALKSAMEKGGENLTEAETEALANAR